MKHDRIALGCNRHFVTALPWGATHTGNLVISMSVDFRGNTDESWSRAAGYLLRNRLLALNYGAPQ